jgi:tetratricopeptide (TPR) repeat protein
MFANSEQESTQDRWVRNLNRTAAFLGAWLVAGIATLSLSALSFLIKDQNITNSLTLLGNGAMLSLAFAAIGGLIGFLFGIPRRLAVPSRSSNDAKSSDSTSHTAEQGGTDWGTNLEQVSDWLTKIILGAGLTQLVKVPGLLRRLGDYFGPSFNNKPFLPLVIVLGSLIFGFFAGYLLTQLFLVQALDAAGKAFLKDAVNVAGNFERMGKFTAATATLEGALSSLGPDTPSDYKQNIYERLTYNALYEPPDGFQKAIRYANEYINLKDAKPSARIWANLAAALGQKYKWDQSKNVPQASLDNTRNSALEAAKKAIALEPGMKDYLRTLWNPHDPTKEASLEDDLEVFYDDPEFKTLLT